jgi:hypothetical protein
LELLEFVQFEYCSTDAMNNFFELVSKDVEELNGRSADPPDAQREAENSLSW